MDDDRGCEIVLRADAKVEARVDGPFEIYFNPFAPPGQGVQWDQAFTYFDRAWGAVLANLQKRFVEQKPIDWSPFMERLKAQAEKATTVKP